MPGLAEILEENARLRKKMVSLQTELSDTQTALATRDEMLEEVQRKAEYLAHQLELAQLRYGGPASQRFVPDEQDLLPFTSEVVPPPRAPVAEPQSDDEATEATPKKRKGSKKPRRRNRQDFVHLSSRPVHCPADDTTCVSCGGPLKDVGKATSFRIEWVPGRFEVHDVSRAKNPRLSLHSSSHS